MSLIQASQLVYSNIDAEEKEGGYRTLFKSLDILDTEASEIESRLFIPLDIPNATKDLFVTLSTGRYLIARVTALDQLDNLKRPGCVYGHALVIAASELENVHRNPFTILANFDYFSSLKEALQAGADLASGNIPVCEISTAPQPPVDDASLRVLSRDEWLPLFLLALRADALRTEAQAVGFYGPPDRILEVLGALFSVLWPSLRGRCSFDTYFLKGSIRNQPYWGVGLPSNERAWPELYAFDLSESRTRPLANVLPESEFEKWLVQKWQTDIPLTQLIREAENEHLIWNAVDAVLGDTPAVAASVDPHELGRALISRREQLRRRVDAQLEKMFCDSLASRLSARSLEWLVATGPDIVRHLESGLREAPFDRWMAHDWLQTTTAPQPAELTGLARYCGGAQADSPLRLVVLRWERRWSDLGTALARLSAERFRAFAKWALATIGARSRVNVLRRRDGFRLNLSIQVREGDSHSDMAPVLSALLSLPIEKKYKESNPPGGMLIKLFQGRREPEAEEDWLDCNLSPNRLAILVELLAAGSVSPEIPKANNERTSD